MKNISRFISNYKIFKISNFIKQNSFNNSNMIHQKSCVKISLNKFSFTRDTGNINISTNNKDNKNNEIFDNTNINMNEDNQKESEIIFRKLYNMCLVNCKIYGFNEDIIHRSCNDLNYSHVLGRQLFINGISDVINTLQKDINNELKIYIDKEISSKNQGDSSLMYNRIDEDLVKLAIKKRLMLISPYILSWNNVIENGLKVKNISSVLSNLFEAVDIILDNDSVFINYEGKKEGTNILPFIFRFSIVKTIIISGKIILFRIVYAE